MTREWKGFKANGILLLRLVIGLVMVLEAAAGDSNWKQCSQSARDNTCGPIPSMSAGNLQPYTESKDFIMPEKMVRQMEETMELMMDQFASEDGGPGSLGGSDKSPAITLVTLCDGPCDEPSGHASLTAAIVRDNHLNYAKARGYEMNRCKFARPLSSRVIKAKVAPSYLKILCLADLLYRAETLDVHDYSVSECVSSQWFVWIDHDVILMNEDARYEDLILKYCKEEPSVQWISSIDFNGFNSGHMLIRASKWTRYHFPKMWKSIDWHGPWNNKDFNPHAARYQDQDLILYYLRSLPRLELRNRLRFLEYSEKFLLEAFGPSSFDTLGVRATHFPNCVPGSGGHLQCFMLIFRTYCSTQVSRSNHLEEMCKPLRRKYSMSGQFHRLDAAARRPFVPIYRWNQSKACWSIRTMQKDKSEKPAPTARRNKWMEPLCE